MGAITLRYQLQRLDDGDYRLWIANCADYASVIDNAFPRLPSIGWRDGNFGDCYTYLRDPDSKTIEALDAFLTFLTEVLLVRKSLALSDFSTEVRSVYALDFNLATAAPLARTRVGELEYQAKYKSDKKAAQSLADDVASAVVRHPKLATVDLVAAIPANTKRAVDLPETIAQRVRQKIGAEKLTLMRAAGPSTKDLAVEEKVKLLSSAFTTDDAVAAKSILLVDDLCQSGASFWSAAAELRKRGSKRVYGFAAVKSWRDTGNT